MYGSGFNPSVFQEAGCGQRDLLCRDSTICFRFAIFIINFSGFFRKKRESFQSYLVCLVCVFWFVVPIGIDTLYLTQGGYRGPGSFQVAVISTTYDLIQYIAAFGVFVALITTLTICVVTIYRVFKAKGIARLYTIAVGGSILALSIQFINWGGFVWD